VEVTVLEVVSADLQPMQCFYHERLIGVDERRLRERILDARVEGAELIVAIRSGEGQTRTTYPFRSTTSFPLALRERLRQQADSDPAVTSQELFDPKSGEFSICDASIEPQRTVELAGRVLQVREITLESSLGSNREWIDASGHPVWRQINGVSLVATRSSEQIARRAETRRVSVGEKPAIVTSPSRGLALWRPNPIWRSAESADEDGDDSVSIEAPMYEGRATLMELDQIQDDLQLVSAADSVVRWLRLLLGSKLTVESRQGVQVRGLPAIRLVTNWFVPQPGGGRAHRGHCYVFAVDDRHFALFCTAPKANFQTLESDFDRILQTVQLSALEVSPPLQGPLVREIR
jgi:hypothetical protein